MPRLIARHEPSNRLPVAGRRIGDIHDAPEHPLEITSRRDQLAPGRQQCALVTADELSDVLSIRCFQLLKVHDMHPRGIV